MQRHWSWVASLLYRLSAVEPLVAIDSRLSRRCSFYKPLGIGIGRTERFLTAAAAAGVESNLAKRRLLLVLLVLDDKPHPLL
jgi:hypothetical protein